MSRRRAAVLGGGGHAKVVIATLQAAGWEVVGVWDDDERRHRLEVLGVPVRGPIAEVTGADADGYVIAVGDNRDRHRIAERLSGGPDLPWVSVVHPSAVVHPSVRLGPGTVVFAGAVIQPETAVGRHVVVNTAASVDHEGVLAAFAHVAPGCRLGGNVTVGEGVLVGIGSTLLPGAFVGSWATVGAGSVVVGTVAAHEIVVGAPARPLRQEPG